MNNLLLGAVAQGGMLPQLIIFAVMGLAFYFMIVKPQKKQQEEFKKQLEVLKVGDYIVTRSGVKGKVVDIKADSFIIETGTNNTQIEYLKQALSFIDQNKNALPDDMEEKFDFPVGDLNYGKDERFINKLKELKAKNPEKEYDILLEDIYEFMVVESDTADISVQNKFRLPAERTEEIMNQFVELGILGEKNQHGNRELLVDPR